MSSQPGACHQPSTISHQSSPINHTQPVRSSPARTIESLRPVGLSVLIQLQSAVAQWSQNKQPHTNPERPESSRRRKRAEMRLLLTVCVRSIILMFRCRPLKKEPSSNCLSVVCIGLSCDPLSRSAFPYFSSS